MRATKFRLLELSILHFSTKALLSGSRINYFKTASL